MKKLLLLLLLPALIIADQKYQFTVPPLPYSYDALEPYIDAQTMHIHHDKHHQAYVDNLNAALKKQPELQTKSLEWLVKNAHQISDESTRTAVINNAGGHWNHSFFWIIMAPEGKKEPLALVAQTIIKQFNSFDNFKTQFNESAKKVFGSGWVWLCVDSDGQLKIITTKDQESPLSQNLVPILGLDVWEHAYYLKYQNKRIDYITAWWNVVNWQQVEENYKNVKKKDLV